MKIKFTLERDGAPAVDVVTETDPTATVADVAAELMTADPRHAALNREPAGLSLAATGPGGGGFVELPADKQIGEAELVSGATVRVVPAGAHRANRPAPAAAMLRVVGGPSPRREFELAVGSTVIGRAPTADCRLEDPMVSRHHARVEVGRTIELVDLNSANGLVVDGGVVTRLIVQPGQVVTIGDTQITVTRLAGVGTGEVRPVGGVVPFNRSPVVQERYANREHPRPAVPSESLAAPFPWLLMIAPVIMGGVLYAATGNALSLLFVIMSPMMMSANFFMTRSRQRHTRNAQVETFTKQLDALSEKLAAEAPLERRVRNEEAPTTDALVAGARTLSPALWTRRPEHWNFLHLRLGTGRAESRNTVAEIAGVADGLPEYEAKLADVVDRFRLIDGVPITESFALCGALGVAGPDAARHDVTRSLLAQLVALHSPAEVVVAAIGGVSGAHEYEWLKWLPHTSAPQSPLPAGHLAASAASAATLLAELEAVVDARTRAQDAVRLGPLPDRLSATSHGGAVAGESNPGAPSVPAIVVLVADDAPVDRARLVQLAERGPAAGVYTLWTAARAAGLPAVCRTFVQLHDAGASVHFVRHGALANPVAVDQLSRPDALSFAKLLAPVVDSAAVVSDSSDLPRSISTLTVLGPEMAEEPTLVVDRWRQNASIHNRAGAPMPRKRASTLRALVGQSGADAMHLDLRTHGPHALVGGTTGSGKSEFLQTWVLGMAAEYSPDRVTFLFVDYKGGSAFAECVHLPHCVGIVTDLSPHLVRRALDSLRAELRRREELFARKKVKDILDFEKSDDPECPPVLVLVIDEFAALVGEVPEFVDGVVDVAQRGRSLGIHLIMATQRPAGVIRENLRANTNLRIALRMADETDSVDVVGEKAAATLDPAIPGRGIAKTGPGRLTPFQAGFSGGWTSNEPPQPSVSVRELRFGAEIAWEAPVAPRAETDPGPNDLSRAVRTMQAAAMLAAIPAPRRPWLEELPRVVDLARLGPRNDRELILGLVDLPRDQAQAIVHWRPDVDGNLAIYGTSGSGKSVLLRSLAAGSAVTPRGGPVHVYAVDCAAGGLRMLDALPNVGAVIPGDDSERVIRLFRQVSALAEERADRFSAVNAENIVRYREAAERPDEPRVLILVDGFASFRSDYEGIGPRGNAYEQFQQLIAEGRALGIHLVFTADRPGAVPSAIASGVPRRVVLRMAEEAMYRALDVPHDVLGPQSPPGRAIVDGNEAQIALFGSSPNAADQYAELRELARSVRVAAPGIAALPSEIAFHALPVAADDLPVLGIGDTRLAPVGFPAEGVMLVGGGPGSGRSNALQVLCASLRRWEPERPFYYLGNRRSSLPAGGRWEATATSVEDVVELAKSLTRDLADDVLGRAVIVVESIGDFLAIGADSAIVALTKAVKRSDALLIAEAETSTWASSLPLFSEVKSARRGLLLQPDTLEGDTILKTTFPRVSRSEFPPGRGFFVSGGRVERVQLPLAPEHGGVLPIPDAVSLA